MASSYGLMFAHLEQVGLRLLKNNIITLAGKGLNDLMCTCTKCTYQLDMFSLFSNLLATNEYSKWHTNTTISISYTDNII